MLTSWLLDIDSMAGSEQSRFLTTRSKQQVSLYINRIPVTSQYDASVRFHVNGYHYRNYVQQHNGWDNRTWDSIDFYSFGKHIKRLTPSQRSLHFKFVHDYLPLGERRFREAPVKDVALKLCPCCKKEDKTPQHFIRCTSNSSLHSSIATLRADILNSDIHPVRYLLADGFCHVIQHDTPEDGHLRIQTSGLLVQVW
jgi:hypothetical protein